MHPAHSTLANYMLIHNHLTLNQTLLLNCRWQDYRIGTARIMSVDIDVTLDQM